MSSDPQRPTEDQPRTEQAPPSDEPIRQPEVASGSHVPAAGKADLTKRAVAGIIDGVAAVLVGFIPLVGGLLSTAYWLARDGLDLEFMPNRSLGKKVVGLKPVMLDGRPVDLETSLKRNWPFAISGVAQILLFIPIIGWLLMVPVALLALAAVIVEVFLVLTDDEGRRLGDRFAETRVVEVGDGML
jgi:uncharacterized RDD family membrane protein YckC